MKNSEKNRLIAKFMGWYIEAEATEDYPEQEWHTTKNKETKGWSGSQCVRLTQSPEEIETKRKEIDEDLWSSLCDNTWSRAGKYHISWDALMPVVEKIESKGFICFIQGNECSIENIGKTIGTFAAETKIDATYKTVVQFIKWYNEQQ